MRFFRVRALFVAAIASLMVGGSLGFAGVASAGVPVPGAIVFHCTGVPGELQQVINNAASGSTIKVDGTCTGGLFIDKNLTLAGPAIIDGENSNTTLVVWYGRVVVLNDLTLQHGFSPFQIGGGLGNNGQTTLNRTTVTENSATFGGGVFNTGQLTLNNSTVSDNTASTGGGIYNCGGNLGDFDCPDGANRDPEQLQRVKQRRHERQRRRHPERPTLSHGAQQLDRVRNTANGGGGIANNGTATINKSTLSGNTGFSGGAINNGVNNDGSGVTTASLTLNNSTAQGNRAILLGGATDERSLTINKGTVSNNSAGPGIPGFFEGGFGGAIFIFSQATTVANSTFSNNPATSGLDTPAGILVQSPEAGGSGTFSATHSTFS